MEMEGGGGMWWCVGGGGGGGYVHGMGEEKVIDDFAYPFAWSLHITCRDSLQKDRGKEGRAEGRTGRNLHKI